MDVLKFLNTISINITMDNVFIFILICVVLYIVILFIKNILKKFKKKLKFVDMNINMANIGSVTIQVNNEVSNIAHKSWIEIMTRKVGLLFEDDKDVIVEVYNSWYEIFKVIRELLKNIEQKKKDEEVQKLIDILLKILNDGLRPHLTQWQAKYRRWYEKELDDSNNKELTPQEIQKKYINYEELIRDLKNTNVQMVQFAQELKKLI